MYILSQLKKGKMEEVFYPFVVSFLSFGWGEGGGFCTEGLGRSKLIFVVLCRFVEAMTFLKG